MPSEPMSDEVERLTAERDALQRHYDAASPEHDLLGLLDLYFERELAAERERDAALAEVARLKALLRDMRWHPVDGRLMVVPAGWQQRRDVALAVDKLEGAQ